MALFVIGDLHLSLNTDKKMDVFAGWENYTERLRLHWMETVHEEDTVVLAGDISWGMSLSEALCDFQFLESLPGRKLLVKGNHDYWWATRSKMEDFFARNSLKSFGILHNCAVAEQNVVLCGSRGWLFEKGGEHDRKIVLREVARLEASLKDLPEEKGERIAFLHYPPVYANSVTPEIIEVLLRYGVRRCFYGHIHSSGCMGALNGPFAEIDFRLVSADYLRFRPLQIVNEA